MTDILLVLLCLLLTAHLTVTAMAVGRRERPGAGEPAQEPMPSPMDLGFENLMRYTAGGEGTYGQDGSGDL